MAQPARRRRPAWPAAWLPALLLACASPAGAAATDPATLLSQAAQADYDARSPADTARAFGLYRQAANAGLPEAQLNVAVMYDSGRGIARDGALAADWYAAAASGGMARAAFDLGQLYEAGDGVPQNEALAKSWFAQAAAEGLAAAAHRPPRPPQPPAGAIASPTPRYPPQAATLPVPQGGLALVWSATPAPAPAAYFVEVMQVQGKSLTPVFSINAPVSSVRMPSPRPGRYAWRVFTVCPTLGRYLASGWVRFSVE